MKVIDNFLPKEDFEKIQNLLMGQRFPWYYLPYIAKTKENMNDDTEDFQFYHVFYHDSSPNDGICSPLFFPFISPFISQLNIKSIKRIKANLNPRMSNQMQSPFHLDYDDGKGKTAIYYVNTNNGYTLFKDGSRVNSVENRIVIFDSNTIHAGVNPTDEKTRVVINFNYNYN